jgi:hypothetical protein
MDVVSAAVGSFDPHCGRSRNQTDVSQYAACFPHGKVSIGMFPISPGLPIST